MAIFPSCELANLLITPERPWNSAVISGENSFGDPIPSPPGCGSGKSSQATPLGLLLLLLPTFTPFFPGAGLFHPVSRQQPGAPGGTSFPEEPAGGTGRGGGGVRGGAKARLATATGVGTRWKTRLRAAQQFAKSGLTSALLRVRPGGAGARGAPGCCMVGGPGHARLPAPDARVAPPAATAPDSGTRSTDALTSDFGVPQP